jgi:hypothetical protein
MTISPDPPADTPPPSTIKEFCKRNRFSPTTYFELRNRGQGPREMRVLSKVLITPEAEHDWRLARETPSSSDIATIEAPRMDDNGCPRR